MESISYCHSLFYATGATEDLANVLIESTAGEMAKVFVVSSGSEAMEAALKLARQYHVEKTPKETQRSHFIARQQSYHGTTLGALAVGGHVARRALYEPMLSDTNSRVSPCFAYRGKKASNEPDAAYVERLEAELDSEFQRVGLQNVAAFIAEPVVGAALGCVPSVSGYFKAVRRVCDKYGALLIFDEIMSGCGRVGPEPTERYPKPLHAWQDPLVGVVPDIMTMGKGLGGGYMPVAAVLANHRVIDTLSRGTGSFSHGQTYQGHPVACRAALEVQRMIRDDDLMTNVRKQGALLGRLLKEKVAIHWAVGDIRGKGFFWGIEFVADKDTKEPYDPSDTVAMGIHELAMQEPYNISLYPGTGTADGRRGDHVLLAPAYNVTEEDIRYIVDTTASVIEQFFRPHIDRGALRVKYAPLALGSLA
ncbi:hypothetical protein LTR37_019514 [Vermiconidia calcicola]|uniref:Uncharacterized protein n=1 Tax=Vermiconidia calcicola TaxID=1690605 RepID=A0ACC3MDU8_9PEZI|nr:hypothetical protein LTR37_019514 [Vermiconidia calcicola]